MWIALGLNAAFMVAEIIGGLAFNSLALLADAGHMLSDVFGLVIALYAQRVASRPASAQHTYGFQRAEVLGALVNGLTLIIVVAWVSLEAIRRLAHPEPVEADGLLLVAALGLVINIGSALLLRRARGSSLNMQAAFIHMASDAAGSVAVIVAAIAVLLLEATWVDPAASLAIAVLILWATFRLLRDTTRVLMEAAPKGMDAAAIEADLASQPGVKSVHHIHIWSLASDVAALSAHVVLTEEPTLHEAQVRGDALREMLHQRHGIDHSTLELECHPCAEIDGRQSSAQ